MTMQPIIIIPAFNEEERIADVVRSLRLCGFKQIVVVDDGSSDQTCQHALEAGAQVLVHSINRGQGAALETGNSYARHIGAELVVHFDGDGQFNPHDIAPAIERLNVENYDVVLGSRFLDDRSSTLPWFKRRVLLPIGKVINHFLTGVSLSDAHNGFRVLGKRALHAIAIVHDGMAHNSDILAQIKQKKLRFIEYPVEVRYHEYGQGVQGGLKILHDWFLGRFVR